MTSDPMFSERDILDPDLDVPPVPDRPARWRRCRSEFPAYVRDGEVIEHGDRCWLKSNHDGLHIARGMPLMLSVGLIYCELVRWDS